MEPILKAENLTKIYSRAERGDMTAVHDVSFGLMPGECLGIIGRSGSGKSTLARMLCRLTDVTRGRIVLDGADITRIRGLELRRVYRDIQMVFQSPTQSFDPRRTLGDGIGESLSNAGMSRSKTREKVRELLERCGLPAAYADRYPHEVSGGQCQRAAIARALAVDPRVLICDEATSALDVTVQEEIMELLGELRRQRGGDLSMIFICHDIALVQRLCDRVMVMHGGGAVETGDIGDVICRPRSEYTKRLMEDAFT